MAMAGDDIMKPYYQDDRSGITIYHGDCREILPHVVADVVVTDPPYGTGTAPRGRASGGDAGHGERGMA